MSKQGVQLTQEQRKPRRRKAVHTIIDARKIFEDGGCTLLSDEYVNSKAKLRYICECGSESLTTLDNFKQGIRCRSCGIKKRSKTQALSYEEVKAEFERGGCMLLEYEYINRSTPMRYICECGNESKIAFHSFKAGSRCRDCGNKKISKRFKKTYEEVRAEFERCGCVLLDDTYIDNGTPLRYICECGEESTIQLNNFTQGQRCKSCGNKKIAESLKLSYEEVKAEFERNGCELLSTEYVNSNTHLDYRCECGEISRIILSSFKQGHRCMKCGIRKTSGVNSCNYKPDKTDEERIIERKFPKYREWRTSVYERDYYTCQCCGRVGGKLAAHHIDGYNWCKERRTDVSNGVTLCKDCHAKFHSIYGKGDNTREQYEEWTSLSEIGNRSNNEGQAI